MFPLGHRETRPRFRRICVGRRDRRDENVVTLVSDRSTQPLYSLASESIHEYISFEIKHPSRGLASGRLGALVLLVVLTPSTLHGAGTKVVASPAEEPLAGFGLEGSSILDMVIEAWRIYVVTSVTFLGGGTPTGRKAPCPASTLYFLKRNLCTCIL